MNAQSYIPLESKYTLFLNFLSVIMSMINKASILCKLFHFTLIFDCFTVLLVAIYHKHQTHHLHSISSQIQYCPRRLPAHHLTLWIPRDRGWWWWWWRPLVSAKACTLRFHAQRFFYAVSAAGRQTSRSH